MLKNVCQASASSALRMRASKLGCVFSKDAASLMELLPSRAPILLHYLFQNTNCKRSFGSAGLVNGCAEVATEILFSRARSGRSRPIYCQNNTGARPHLSGRVRF